MFLVEHYLNYQLFHVEHSTNNYYLANLSTLYYFGGPYRDRTGYLFHAMEALYQLS